MGLAGRLDVQEADDPQSRSDHVAVTDDRACRRLAEAADGFVTVPAQARRRQDEAERAEAQEPVVRPRRPMAGP